MKKLLTGIAAGSFVGAVFGVLFAPKKGKELRTDITNQYKKAKQTSQETVEKAKNGIKKIRVVKSKSLPIKEEAVAEKVKEEVKPEAKLEEKQDVPQQEAK